MVSGASNRWTHFGARLKPLTTSGADHHSADSRSLAAFAHNNSNKNGQQRAQTTTSLGQALGGNQVGEVSASDDADDADDDQDSEALLYKMEMSRHQYHTHHLILLPPKRSPQNVARGEQ